MKITKQEFDEIIERCAEDISGIRASRATPALVENIFVDAYGSKTPIQQLATISTPDPRTIIIQPWDKSVVKNIEDGIRASDLGLNPGNEGDLIRLVLPALSEERRKELVRTLNQRLEQFRVRVRQERDKIKEEIINSEKEKAIGEDEKFRLLEDLDKITAQYVEKIKTLGEKKEQDIMTV